MTVLPLMLANDPESNFENVHSTNDQALAFKKRLYKNQNLRKIIEKSLLKFDHLGLLDDMVWMIWCISLKVAQQAFSSRL